MVRVKCSSAGIRSKKNSTYRVDIGDALTLPSTCFRCHCTRDYWYCPRLLDAMDDKGDTCPDNQAVPSAVQQHVPEYTRDKSSLPWRRSLCHIFNQYQDVLNAGSPMRTIYPHSRLCHAICLFSAQIKLVPVPEYFLRNRSSTPTIVVDKLSTSHSYSPP